MTTKIIRKEKLSELFGYFVGRDAVVIAPVKKREKVFFGRTNNFSDTVFDYVQTAFSGKSAVFPRCEELIKYSKTETGFSVSDPEFSDKEIVLFGVKPCDAGTFAYLNDFFTKENPDVHFQNRMKRLTVISITCKTHDDNCFCTSVGNSPGDTKGADICLTEIENGDFYAEILTDKGNETVSRTQSVFTDTNAIDKSKYVTKVPEVFDLKTLQAKIKDGVYDNPSWQFNSLACLGCGACAYSCPTCTCFDIQDESKLDGGSRVRTWDTCALGLFTLHTSGHNPRHDQTQRWKQRILHKFDYSERNFGQVTCVGCGRCSRNCPAQMSILEQINGLTEA